MKRKNSFLLSGLVLGLVFSLSAPAQTLIVGDNYNVTPNGTGFALDTGVNAGINPPTTRLTGTAAAGLRYIKTSGAKADSAHSISASGKMNITRVSTDSSTISLSSGTGAFDFGPVLNTLALSPSEPAVYELTISITNGASGTQRCSFALSSVQGTAGAWEFGVQLWRATTADTFYTISRRISYATTPNAVMSTAAPYPNETTFTIRVTDAGAETATYNSRVQVSLDGGATWIYDTLTDTDLANGFHFTSASRFIYWDIAGGAGPVTYDNFSLKWISGPTAGTRIWTGNGSDNNWSTPANWNGVAPSTGDSVVFNGTTRQANVNDIAGLTVPSLTFNNGGFSLSGGVSVSGSVSNLAGINSFAGNLDWASVAPKIWSIANGGELDLNATTTGEVNGDQTLLGGGILKVNGTMNIGQSTTANPAFIINDGRLLLNNGGAFNTRGGVRIGSVAGPTTAPALLATNANLSLTLVGANLRVGDSANPQTVRLVLDNSTANMAGGIISIPQAAGATGEVTQVGGSLSGARLSFSEGGAGFGSYALKNSTLGAYQIRKNTGAGVANMYFDSATLQVLANATNAFMSGLNTAEIQAGGLTLDAQGDATIAQPFSGTGTLTKAGQYTIAITGQNTYSGNTLVTAGKLLVGTGKAVYNNVQVSDYAGFGVVATAQDGTATNGTVAMGGATSLTFDLATFVNPTNAMLFVTNLSANGYVSFELKKTGLGLSAGVIPLIAYQNLTGSADNFVQGGITLPSGVQGQLVNNAGQKRIDLQITGVPGYVWNPQGGSTAWDMSSPNWIDKTTGLPSATYQDGYPAEFFDGAASGLVDIVGAGGFVSPSSIVISNNTLPYVFNSGGITAPIFKKYGSNLFYRPSYDADVLANGIELNQGSLLVSNGTFSVLLTDAGKGTGTLLKQGTDQLLLNSTNPTYDGYIRIEEGILKLGNSDSLGRNGGVTILPGATLDLNDHQPGAKPVTVSGSGSAGQGAITDSATATGVETNLRDVTLADDTTFGSNGRWDLRIRASTGPGPGLKGNGHNLTKVGPGSVSIASQRNLGVDDTFWNLDLGNVYVREGTLTFAENLNPSGGPEKIVAVSPGATISHYSLALTNPILRTICLTNAEIESSGANASATNVFYGPILVSGAATFNLQNDAQTVVNGQVSGGTMNVTGTALSSMTLNGANTVPGLNLTNGILAGNGSISGNLLMLGGTLAPGDGIGTFTVGGNATLAGTTTMELNRNLSPNSDRLVVNGTITWGGTLKIVLAGAPAGQDVYQLFNKGVNVPSGSIQLPDLSGYPGGLSWDTSNLAVNGSIKVNGAAAPPNIGSVSQSNGTFSFSGTGGTEGATYYVVTSPTVTAPLSTWTPVLTNTFGPGGTFTFSTNIVSGATAAFYSLRVP